MCTSVAYVCVRSCVYACECGCGRRGGGYVRVRAHVLQVPRTLKFKNKSEPYKKI